MSKDGGRSEYLFRENSAIAQLKSVTNRRFVVRVTLRSAETGRMLNRNNSMGMQQLTSLKQL